MAAVVKKIYNPGIYLEVKAQLQYCNTILSLRVSYPLSNLSQAFGFIGLLTFTLILNRYKFSLNGWNNIQQFLLFSCRDGLWQTTLVNQFSEWIRGNLIPGISSCTIDLALLKKYISYLFSTQMPVFECPMDLPYGDRPTTQLIL
jgi:hypothetical protein